jgi:uncharacterized damage-inducible protein DinB
MDKIYKPAGEFPSFYQMYMDCVPNDGELIRHLKDILTETKKITADLSEEKLNYRYSIGKWTIKDILVHISDCERVIIYRVMRIARADKTELPGFDENLFAANANVSNRKVDEIIKELSALRAATVVFIETIDETLLNRTGTAYGYPLSIRLLVNHIYGNHRHHLNIIRERYL